MVACAERKVTIKLAHMVKPQATLILKEKSIPCYANTPVWKSMKAHGFSRSAFLIVRDGDLITDDEILKAGDQIELIPVVSGG